MDIAAQLYKHRCHNHQIIHRSLNTHLVSDAELSTTIAIRSHMRVSSLRGVNTLDLLVLHYPIIQFTQNDGGPHSTVYNCTHTEAFNRDVHTMDTSRHECSDGRGFLEQTLKRLVDGRDREVTSKQVYITPNMMDIPSFSS